MAITETDNRQANPEAAAFINDLIETAARQRLPDLFAGEHPDALYHVPDRNGVSVLVVRTPQLSEEHLVKLMKYRLATWRYKHDPSATHLGFIIDDVEPSPSIAPTGQTVDLYGYTSMAVAAVQLQAQQIEDLQREVRALEAQLGKRSRR